MSAQGGLNQQLFLSRDTFPQKCRWRGCLKKAVAPGICYWVYLSGHVYMSGCASIIVPTSTLISLTDLLYISELMKDNSISFAYTAPNHYVVNAGLSIDLGV